MAGTKSITIIGGGLAGLTLGLGLRQLGVAVTICEAGRYPRHRVCGEFISGCGQLTLARLGLRALLDQAGAVPAHTTAFYSATRASVPRSLPSPALCLSRFKLDAALAKQFRDLGGELREDQRAPLADLGEGLVRATGRRAEAEPGGARWFGLKVHARNVSLTADLEMHVSPRGYVGLCRLDDGEVNVCGLFRKKVNDGDGLKNSRELLRGQPGSALRERLADAVFDDDSFCSVAGLCLSPRQAVTRAEISVGDAITMIPPVTGNGMSMAFESAELAVAPLAAWSRGEASWGDVRRQIAQSCDAAFARRLLWAKWLQRLILAPALQTPLVVLAARCDGFWQLAFDRTR